MLQIWISEGRNPMSVMPFLPVKVAPIPAAAKPTYDAIVALTDRFSQAHLTYEYQMLCRKLAGVLGRKRPAPLTRGKPEVWACAILRVIGWVNFLDDSSQQPHMKLTAIDKAFGVAESTGQGKAKAIRELLKIRQFEFRWMLRRRIEESTVAWMIEVNGFITTDSAGRRRVGDDVGQEVSTACKAAVKDQG
jgi:hypothetical protein